MPEPAKTQRRHRSIGPVAFLVALTYLLGAAASPASTEVEPFQPAEVVALAEVVDIRPPPLPVADKPATLPEPDDDPLPPVTDPVTIVIPAIGVDATVVPVGLKPDGAMQVPDFGLSGWYTEGPRPGEVGPAVIAAHVDSRQGPDVFFRLRELTPGDEIHVAQQDGSTVTFVVETLEQELKDQLPVDRIWDDTDVPVLRLITCGGEFDRSRRSYRSNVIVYAALVDA